MADKQAVPQLRMGHRRLGDVAPPAVPHGYALRAFRRGDEDAWLALLQSGDFSVWDRARLDWMIGGGRAPMPLDGIFFSARGDLPVAAACTFLHTDAGGGPPTAELGWVVTHPDHRGRGLAECVCRAVLAYARGQGCTYCYLKTEDFRASAIKLYLRLGFEPEMVDPSHPAWWSRHLREAG